MTQPYELDAEQAELARLALILLYTYSSEEKKLRIELLLKHLGSKFEPGPPTPANDNKKQSA